MHVFREREALTVLSFESFQTIISGVAFVFGKSESFYAENDHKYQCLEHGIPAPDPPQMRREIQSKYFGNFHSLGGVH
jgi:hypothetical protein